MTVVLDTNVFVSAIFWPGDDRRCLAQWSRRKFRVALTPQILDEYRETALRLAAEFSAVNPKPWLDWIADRAVMVEPTQLGKRRSRDADDDAFLACALAAGAEFIVSKDRHLLRLGKPFGIEILTPRDFLRRLKP
jgi:putative PIN family toxin of toxin-antitoxin system